jgi:hypothetical protein
MKSFAYLLVENCSNGLDPSNPWVSYVLRMSDVSGLSNCCVCSSDSYLSRISYIRPVYCSCIVSRHFLSSSIYYPSLFSNSIFYFSIRSFFRLISSFSVSYRLSKSSLYSFYILCFKAPFVYRFKSAKLSLTD